MALDNTKIQVGAGTVKVGPYVTAAGAGTLVDWGHTMTPTEVTANMTNFDVITERSIGRVKSVPLTADFSIKLDVAQAETYILSTVLKQVSGQTSGSGANLTLKVTDPIEVYYQVSITGPGPGTTASRILTFWKCQPRLSGGIPFAKAGVQVYPVIFDIFRDDSVVGANPALYWQQVDS